MAYLTTRLTAAGKSVPGATGVVLALSAVFAATAETAHGFDFDHGNAPIEIVIPAAIPAIFEAVQPACATLVVRFTTLLTNAWFDAAAPYHPTAVGIYSRLGRQPASAAETNAALNTAILYASYRTLNSLFPERQDEWRAMMNNVGLDPDDNRTDLNHPAGIGNTAAAAMLAVRENDGMNQLGNEGGRLYNLTRYADYTGYVPVNTAYEFNNPSRWQPNILVSPFGISTVQQFVTPQTALVLPYSIGDPSAYTVAPPSASQWTGNPNAPGLKKQALQWRGPNAGYASQADGVIQASANLTDEQKMMAELFDDKIRSLGFSTLFAAQSRQLSLIEFVHYDFLVNAAAFDAGIVMWKEKRLHDAVRPFSAIRFLYGDAPITAWGGPGQGTVTNLPASQWRGYLHVADHPEYPSGSTGFCEAHAQASRLYFGDDDLGWQIPAAAGSSVVEPGVTPQQDIVLNFTTWTDFAETCGVSRLWGGVHFLPSIDNMRELGRDIGSIAYDFVMNHIEGTAAF